MYAFVVAAPRSGTTIFGDVLGRHPEVTSWHEPYFVWDYLLPHSGDDRRDATSATESVKRFVRKEFEYFQTALGKEVVLEKTPTNAFKIEYMRAIFPEAKWIHLYRDGRDVVSSLKQRYARRKDIATEGQLRRFLRDVRYTLQRQPLWRHRLLAVWYELKNQDRLAPYWARSGEDWSRMVGFGPRFPNWREYRRKCSDLEFMAYQWVKCEKSIAQGLKEVPGKHRLEVCYERFVDDPQSELQKVCEFLGVSSAPVQELASAIVGHNVTKWKQGLTAVELESISPIIERTQVKLGYAMP
ncbi:MAG: sulfotransferase [Pseudomonadota bacterium]|nr:MAG: sulfotransferase [Pseudomonadota bacterium]